MAWLSDQFEYRRLFRRLVVLIVLALVWATTLHSFEVAPVLAATKLTGAEIVSILGAIHLPVLTLMGYIFKEYNKGRMQKQ